MKFAVHLSDLLELPDAHPISLFLGPFLIQETVQVDKAIFDAWGVLVNDELPGRDWYAAMEIVQIRDMPGRGYPIRIYKSRTGQGGWVKVKKGEFASSEPQQTS